MIMLPIPVPIIASNKRLFIPLIYLAVTASICYLFLLAFVKVAPTHFHEKNKIRNKETSFPFKRKLDSQENKSLSRTQTFAKFKREVEADSYFEAYSAPYLSKAKTKASPFDSWKTKKKKLSTPSVTKLRNGTRRSHSSKVFEGHQNIDSSADSIHPWPEDPQCSRFQTHFAKKKTFKPRALVSFPGSGNSWLRYLIECSTGIFTGSVFNDTKLCSTGLLGELRSPNDGSTIVQKTHHDALRFSSTKSKQAYVKLTELMFGYRGILLIRNPYDALISYWNFVETHDHRGHASKAKFNPYKWQNFVLTLIPKWTSMIMSWVDKSQSLLIVQYEKLEKNPHLEIIRILEYLEQAVDEERLSCLLQKDHVEGPFHRHKDTNQNSFFTNNNPFLRRKESSSWKNDSNISPPPLLLPSLDLIVQDNINHINRFFSDKYIPIFLNYKGPTTCCNF